jgi:alanine racemase
LRELSASSTKNPVHIHLKIDTGMGRQGILPEEIDTAITILTHSKHIVLQGICSHFPDADNTDPSFTQVQIKKWNGIVKKFRVLSAEQIPLFPSLKYWHLSNTDGHEYSKEIDANVSRLGIGLYLHPTPVLEMKTVITSIKKIKKGDKVGYSGTFIAPHDMTIATIPVGYFEGVDRRLSNTGFVKVIKNGDTATYFAPIIGRVSMNITTIDVSGILDVKQSDSVVAISANPKDTNSVEAIALTCETISYEILVHIPAHLKRVVKQVHFQ